MRIGKTLQAAGLAFAVVLLVASMASAQVSTSNISGTVTDKSGAVIVGAKVVAKNEATGVKYETTTTSAGSYTISSLSPGQYTITVTHPGFKTLTSAHNVLTVGAPLVVDVTLELGATSEVIEVEATYERLDTTSAMLSGVVGRSQIVGLPLNGRNPLNLIVFEPGVVQRPGGALGSGTHVYGSRDRAHNVTIDGIDANESSVPNPQSNIYRLSPDNVQEYRVVTHNATSEFGRNSGANVAIATRSGTNEFHGDVGYSHRNTALNANEFFNNASGVDRPILLLHQFGGNVGGPIIKNRTFFFFSYAGNRIKQTQPISQSFGVPSAYTRTAKQGIFRFVRGTVSAGGQSFTRNDRLLVDASGNLLPGVPLCGGATTINCVASYNMFGSDPAGIGPDTNMMAMINSFPLPNNFSSVGDGLNTAGFSWNTPSRFKGPFFLLRGDHKFNDNHNLFARMLWSKYDTTEGDLLNARGATFPGFAPLGEVFRSSQSLAISYRAVLSQSMVNEFTTGYSRFQFFFSLVESNAPSNPPPYGQECFGTDSLGNIDTPFCNTPHTQRAVSTIQFIDNFSYTRGAHSIRTGFNFRFYRHNDERGVPGGLNLSPTIIFSRSIRSPFGATANTAPGVAQGFATVPTVSGTSINSIDNNTLQQTIVELMGIPARVQQTYQADFANDLFTNNLYVLGTRAKHFNVYLQDQWKVRRNLTATFGVRWEWNQPPKDCCDRTFVPDLAVDGSQGRVTYVPADSWFGRNNANAFAPRISLAWDPWSNGKTVVRAGWGIAFDTISTFQVTSIGGKVPGSVFQCRVDVQATAAGSAPCMDIPNNLRLTGLLAAINPFALPIPNSRPSALYSPPEQRAGTAPSVGAFSPNLKVPTVHEWSLTIQRELPWRFTAQVGYVGKRGMRLFHSYDINQIRTDQPGLLQEFLVAQQNLFICQNNSLACLAAQTTAGISAANRTADNFANFGLAGQLSLPILTQLLGATSNASSVFRGSNATDVTLNGLGGLINRVDVNDTIAPRGFAANTFRRNAQFADIFYLDNSGDSYYHGLIAQLRRRFEKGLTMGLAYTLSKSIDTLSVDPTGATSGGGLSTTNERTPVDARNIRMDRALSGFDNRHVIVTNALYELPFGQGRRWGSQLPKALNHIVGGWTLTGIYSWQSGEPFSIESGVLTVHNAKVSRADLRGPFIAPKVQEAPGITGPVVYNTSPLITDNRNPNYNCRNVLTESGAATTTFFCIPPPGQFGNLGRNVFKGPGFWNMDIGILKTIPITERVNLQFRTEMFNALNHVNFDNPRNASDGTPRVTSLAFGQTCCVATSVPSSTTVVANGEPNRVIQFALRLSF